jgi:hypothetical protein
MLSQADTAIIVTARRMLNDLDSVSVRQATTTDNAVETFSWGRFAEACKTASDALHEVLAVADSYLDDVHATAALREGR